MGCRENCCNFPGRSREPESPTFIRFRVVAVTIPVTHKNYGKTPRVNTLPYTLHPAQCPMPNSYCWFSSNKAVREKLDSNLP
ncbi:MAG: hypothetical protein F6J93_09265 [Oscillatoria sp. SIO1A7]|nr:hypothetical protein [Oscillatoria sp. SIO1A7]